MSPPLPTAVLRTTPMKRVSRFVVLAFVPPSGFVFRVTRESSCRTFPGVRVPPAATHRGARPDRNRDRHVRCESQALADGFRPTLARSCLLLPDRPTENGLAVGFEHSRPDLVIS